MYYVRSAVAAMLPYKIRKAAWGCLKPPKEVLDDPIVASSSSSSSLLRLRDDDPHVIGGNLQSAILMDLVDLRRDGITLRSNNN